jgi:uncharacterized protein (DUF2336 family)
MARELIYTPLESVPEPIWNRNLRTVKGRPARLSARPKMLTDNFDIRPCTYKTSRAPGTLYLPLLFPERPSPTPLACLLCAETPFSACTHHKIKFLNYFRIRLHLLVVNRRRRRRPVSSSKARFMYPHRSLISELEDAVRRGSQSTRVETLRRITELFLGANEQLNEEQILVFDQVLAHLITRMESTALIELSERLAPIHNAPIKVVHTLAHDDEIAIAGPVLSMSDRLTTPDLIEIAMAKSQSHLLAISKRSNLSESLTDVLIERGDPNVIRKLAENAGVRFSEKAYAYLVDQPKVDETLLEILGLRLDIPLNIFLRLLERVTEAVRTRLLRLAQQKRDDIKDVLATISNDVIECEEVDLDFDAAERLVSQLQKNGELDEFTLLEFAKKRQYAATVTALATLCAVSIDMMKNMLSDGRKEPLLVSCKAAGVAWPTLRALLQEDLLGKIPSEAELKKLKSEYTRLSQSTAKQLFEFWCEHQTPQNP